MAMKYKHKSWLQLPGKLSWWELMQEHLCSRSSFPSCLEWGCDCWSSSSCIMSMRQYLEWTHVLWLVEQNQEGSLEHGQNCAWIHHRSPGAHVQNSLRWEKNKILICLSHCLWDAYEYLSSFPNRAREEIKGFSWLHGLWCHGFSDHNPG